MQIFKSSLWTILWIGTRMISSFFINKIVSIFYGPSGIALLSHIQNIFATFLIFCQEGINKGMIAALSTSHIDKEKQGTIIASGALWSAGVYILIILASLFYFNSLTVLFHVTRPSLWLAVGLIGIGLLIVQYFLLSLFLAWDKIKWYNIINIIGSLGTMPIVYWASKYGGLDWMLLAATCGLFFTSIISIVVLKFLKIHTFSTSTLPSSEYHKGILQFVYMALGIMVFGKFTDLGLRQFAFSQFSVEEVGLWQAVVKLSDYYTVAFTSLLSVVYFPKLPALLSHPKELQKFVFQTILWIYPILILGLVFVYLFRTPLILILFNSSFESAEQFVSVQVLSDALKFLSFFLVFIMYTQARTTLFLILDASSALLYISLSYYFSQIMGLDGLLLAQLVRYFYYLIFLIIVYRRLIWRGSLSILK